LSLATEPGFSRKSVTMTKQQNDQRKWKKIKVFTAIGSRGQQFMRSLRPMNPEELRNESKQSGLWLAILLGVLFSALIAPFIIHWLR
jgi:uncharacterized membrane protein YoaK (UPF0700 family)